MSPSPVRLATGLAVVAVLLLPSSSFADSVKRYDPGGVPRGVVERFGLTDHERRALDISSLRVTGAEGFGVMLEVRLHGDFQRRIGRSGLRRAALEVSLHSAGGSASAVSVLTRGEAVRSQRVLSSPAETTAVAVRTGRTVRVFVRAPGFASMERVEVRSFVRGSVQAEAFVLPLDPVETVPAFASCDEFEHMYEGITSALTGADRLVFRLERLMAERAAQRRAIGGLRATHRFARRQRGLLLAIGGDAEVRSDPCYPALAGG